MEINKNFKNHNGFVSHEQFNRYEEWIFNFNNGYGASVITGSIVYCNEKKPFELAVLKHGKICYDTPITDDVISYLTSNEVYELLDRIEQL